MKKFFRCLVVVVSISTQHSVSAHGRADSLLKVLDETLERRENFEARLQGRIAEIRAGLDSKLSTRQQYLINKELIEHYRSYIYDSAMYYIAQNRTLAAQIGDRRLINENRIDYSGMLLSGGMYHEAIGSLALVPRGEMRGEGLVDYWQVSEQIYHHMSLYTAGSPFEEHYGRISRAYVDSLAGVLDENSERYFALSRIYLSNADKRIGQAKLRNLMDRLRPGSHDYAIVASTLADTYDMHDETQRRVKIELLAASAIADVESNVKEYVSLSSLGGVLYLEGDVERAYRYGVISLEDANFYNARLRRIELSRIFPIIEKAYKQDIDRKNARLRTWGWATSMLAVLMLGVIIYGARLMYLLRRTRQKLLSTNDRLTESGRVKEEYLGRFLRMSSSYINRLDRYRNTIHTKLAAGRIDEVRTMVRSSAVIDHEISEFYRSFDKAFLRLYPDFVAGLDALLNEGEGIRLREGELMSTEARIYALVRLGISNPADIAKFLRYSPNTVYAYRHKVRARARNKETFEEDILDID